MRPVLLLLTCSILPAACGRQAEVHADNASVAEVQNKVAAATGGDSFVRPGRWESKVTFEEFDMPGAPPAAASVMRSMNERGEVHSSCLTPEEVKRPKEDFFAGDNKNCRYDRFNMANGKIDAVMKCAGGGGTQTMTMTGAYTPDTYQMQMAMRAEGDGATAGMRMKMRVDARRAGECNGTES